MRLELNPAIPEGAHKVGERPLEGGVLFVWKFGPKHYYGTVQWSNGQKQRVERLLTAAELGDYDWQGYVAGESTQRHYSLDHVARSARGMSAPEPAREPKPPTPPCDDEDDEPFSCNALGSRWTVGFSWESGHAWLRKDGRTATHEEQCDLEEAAPEWLYRAAYVVVHHYGMDPSPDVVRYWWDDPGHHVSVSRNCYF